MIVRFGFAPRAKGLTPEEAAKHWRGTHGGLAAGLPGLRRYVQNHTVLRAGRPLLPHPGFDVFSETEFDSVEAMEAAFASSLYRQAITDDEISLIRRELFGKSLTKRQVLVDGDPGQDSVKLITLLRAHPAHSQEALFQALSGPYAAAVARARPLRHEVLISLQEEGPHAFDAADEIWFPDARQALEHVNSAAGDEAGMHLAGYALGRERVIARPLLLAGPRLP